MTSPAGGLVRETIQKGQKCPRGLQANLLVGLFLSRKYPAECPSVLFGSRHLAQEASALLPCLGFTSRANRSIGCSTILGRPAKEASEVFPDASPACVVGRATLGFLPAAATVAAMPSRLMRPCACRTHSVRNRRRTDLWTSLCARPPIIRDLVRCLLQGLACRALLLELLGHFPRMLMALRLDRARLFLRQIAKWRVGRILKAA